MSNEKGNNWFLYIGGLAAILASTCCLGPLLLMALGFSGIWISHLAILEPYRWLFILIAFGTLLWSGWKIFFNKRCKPGDVCAVPRVNKAYKAIFWIVLSLVIVALGFPYIAPYFY